ncbi:MAG: VOC family protein [Oscillospiraceae bacterium]|nr:VOC family protein [Oscillospiraceae bacterium]
MMTNPNKNMLVTLGVRDVAKAIDFYNGLGFKVTFDGGAMGDFEMDGVRVALYCLDALANDVNVHNPPKISTGFSGITLAYNLDSKEAVDEMHAKVKALGGSVEHAPEKAKDWNGYHFYFRDLDGHYWEIAY